MYKSLLYAFAVLPLMKKDDKWIAKLKETTQPSKMVDVLFDEIEKFRTCFMLQGTMWLIINVQIWCFLNS